MGRDGSTEAEDTARHCAAHCARCGALCGAVIPPDPNAGRRLLDHLLEALRARFRGGRIMAIVPGGARSFTHADAERELAELEREAGVDLI